MKGSAFPRDLGVARYLLSILFTEVFMFYRNQAAALVVLAFNLF
jgi:hypothetical protein